LLSCTHAKLAGLLQPRSRHARNTPSTCSGLLGNSSGTCSGLLGNSSGTCGGPLKPCLRGFGSPASAHCRLSKALLSHGCLLLSAHARLHASALSLVCRHLAAHGSNAELLTELRQRTLHLSLRHPRLLPSLLSSHGSDVPTSRRSLT
jgi:hypothetical protein